MTKEIVFDDEIISLSNNDDIIFNDGISNPLLQDNVKLKDVNAKIIVKTQTDGYFGIFKGNLTFGKDNACITFKEDKDENTFFHSFTFFEKCMTYSTIKIKSQKKQMFQLVSQSLDKMNIVDDLSLNSTEEIDDEFFMDANQYFKTLLTELPPVHILHKAKFVIPFDRVKSIARCSMQNVIIRISGDGAKVIFDQSNGCFQAVLSASVSSNFENAGSKTQIIFKAKLTQ